MPQQRTCIRWLIHLSNANISVPRNEFYSALKHYFGTTSLVKKFEEAEMRHNVVFLSIPNLCYEDYAEQMYKQGRGLGNGEDLSPRPIRLLEKFRRNGGVSVETPSIETTKEGDKP